MSITLTTTGNTPQIVINDLGRLVVNHPYSGDLLQIFNIEDLINSVNLQEQIDNDNITLTDSSGGIIYFLDQLIEVSPEIIFSFSSNTTNTAPVVLNSHGGIRSDRSPYYYSTNYIFTKYRITNPKLLVANISYYIDSCALNLDPLINANWVRVSTVSLPLNTRFVEGNLSIILGGNLFIRGGVISGGSNNTRPDYPLFEVFLKKII
ncbi:MAG: hypothetical protein ACRCU6_09120 [Fusobacteriaceae bacterium]